MPDPPDISRDTERLKTPIAASDLQGGSSMVASDLHTLTVALHCIYDGVAVTDARGEFVIFNPAAEKILGVGALQGGPRTWSEGYGLFRPHGRSLYPPEELPLSRAMRGEIVTNCEVWVRRPSHTKLTILSVNAAPLQNADGDVLGGVAVFRDVTRQKQLERQLKVERNTLRKLLAAREQERTLLAYDLHDGLLQDVVGSGMILSALQAQCEAFAPGAAQQLNKAGESLRRAVNEGRRIIAGMRPMIVDDENLVEALAALVDDFSHDTPIKIEFVHFAHTLEVSGQIQATLFRILQESLTNAIRHSETRNIVVLLTELPAAIQLEIRDWGIGFDPKQVSKRGVGLQSIRDRARLFGGRCRILSRPGHGTRIVVRFLLETAGESQDGNQKPVPD